MSAQAAPIALTAVGNNYVQSFDTLANTGNANLASTLPSGWAISTPSYSAGSGTSTTGGIRSYGPTGQTDRALGSLSNGTGTLRFGAEFSNQTGSLIDSLDIQYIGEQWRRGANSAIDTLLFEISFDATSLSTGTWNSVSALNFASPVTGAGPGTALNGNLSANRTLIQSTITGLSLNDGANFWIRWSDLDLTSGLDHGLAVDDFNITPLATIPEPATIAVLGVGLLAVGGIRRRRRRAD